MRERFQEHQKLYIIITVAIVALLTFGPLMDCVSQVLA